MEIDPVCAKAVVKLTLVIELHDRWPMAVDMVQIQRQASVSAIGTLDKLIATGSRVNQQSIRLEGKPEVTAILVGVSPDDERNQDR